MNCGCAGGGRSQPTADPLLDFTLLEHGLQPELMQPQPAAGSYPPGSGQRSVDQLLMDIDLDDAMANHGGVY